MLYVHHDFTSPASVVAVLRLQHIADTVGRVRFVGIDVLGTSISLPPTLGLLAEFERWASTARQLGFAMRRPSHQPPTLSCHLVADVADAAGLESAWRMSVLTAYWRDDADIADHAVLTELAEAAGIDRPTVAERLADSVARRALAGEMAARRRNGVGGVPVLEFDGTLTSADLSDEDLRRLAML